MTKRKKGLLAALERSADRQLQLQQDMTPNDRLLARDAASVGWKGWVLGLASVAILQFLKGHWDLHWTVKVLLIIAAFVVATFTLGFAVSAMIRKEIKRRKTFGLINLLSAIADHNRAAKTPSVKLAAEDRLPPVTDVRCPYCEAAPGTRHNDKSCPAIPRTWFNAA